MIDGTKDSIRLRNVVGLASLSLLLPALTVVVNQLGNSASSIAPAAAWIWLLIAAAWVVIVWLARTARPLATLVLTGLVSGALTVLAVGAIQLVFSGSMDLLKAPIGIVALIALGTLGGFICGLIAWGLQSVTKWPER
ncbi:hypothetical protein [Homoserinimonas sp. OAct 916]|uniref:hypothetical protein n=1 Tax=Homoserinimonas sp. OAct 916 TaxID=2211450 RepID=UPI000DBE78C0|nr:hypothetical protein [Homoserinimonas sp. OAct 916]